MNTETWQARAACLEYDPELFFPRTRWEAAKARAICTTACPVRAECLNYAQRTDSDYGIWGGINQRTNE